MYRRRVVACAVFLSFFWAQAASAATPISGSNSPTPLSGQTNGELPASALIRVSADCQTARAAGPSLSLMLKAADADGVTVRPSECYRPLSGQIDQQQSWTNAGNSACAAAPTTSPTGKVVGTSNHGWGKAADINFGGGEFNSAGYKWLKANAATYGWNHPAWAEPGGSACPEAWHWEWVGDGGKAGGDPIHADVVGMVPSPDDGGFLTVDGLGGVAKAGNAVSKGDATSLALNWVMVGTAATPDRNGYWMVGADGGVFSYGNASFYGSAGSIKLNKSIVGMAPTPTGHGYWLVASDGGVFSYGDAGFYGSTGSMRLNKSIVGMTASPTGHGYWLVAADGGVFAFGDAGFYGSTGSIKLNKPVMGIAATPDGKGYWMVASDGGVFAFGNAPFFGSLGSLAPPQPVVAINRTTSGTGYWITIAHGGVVGFGTAQSYS